MNFLTFELSPISPEMALFQVSLPLVEVSFEYRSKTPRLLCPTVTFVNENIFEREIYKFCHCSVTEPNTPEKRLLFSNKASLFLNLPFKRT